MKVTSIAWRACGALILGLAAVTDAALAQEAVPQDLSSIPFYEKTNDGNKASIKGYAAAKGPKALAINQGGQTYWWGPVSNSGEAVRRALENCELSNKSPCVIAAIDDAVQKHDPAAQLPSAFASLGNKLEPEKVPFLSDAARKALAGALDKARAASPKYMALALHPRNGWYLKAEPGYASQADADNAALSACVGVTPPNRFWSRGACFLFAQGMEVVVFLPLDITYASRSLVLAAESPEQSFANETRDWGIQATNRPQGPPYGTPTPMTIPGARVIKTLELSKLLDADKKAVVVDVLNNTARTTVRGAHWMPGAGDSGFGAAEKNRFVAAIDKITGGDKTRPVVFMCLGPECWESYNACLYAMEAGFKEVHWYRGGRLAWTAARLEGDAPGQRAW